MDMIHMFRRPKPQQPKVEAPPKPVEALPKPKVLMGGHGPRIMHARMHDLDSADHPNVYVINPINGEVLTYSAALQKWINQAVAGMVEHGNEWHEPDMAVKSDFDAHVASTETPHISQALKDKIHDRLHALDSALDHSGVLALAQIPTPLTGKDADLVDGAHLSDIRLSPYFGYATNTTIWSISNVAYTVVCQITDYPLPAGIYDIFFSGNFTFNLHPTSTYYAVQNLQADKDGAGTWDIIAENYLLVGGTQDHRAGVTSMLAALNVSINSKLSVRQREYAYVAEVTGRYPFLVFLAFRRS